MCSREIKTKTMRRSKNGGFGVLVIVVFFSILQSAAAETAAVKVGVVLDSNAFGKMGLSCISMALSDFYDSRSHYKTRVVLNTTDSNGTVVGAAAAGSFSHSFSIYI